MESLGYWPVVQMPSKTGYRKLFQRYQPFILTGKFPKTVLHFMAPDNFAEGIKAATLYRRFTVISFSFAKRPQTVNSPGLNI